MLAHVHARGSGHMPRTISCESTHATTVTADLAWSGLHTLLLILVSTQLSVQLLHVYYLGCQSQMCRSEECVLFGVAHTRL